MLNRKKHLDIYLTILAVFVIASTVLRTIAALTELDYVYGQYTGSVLISVADWITFGGCVVLLSYLALSPRNENYRGSFNNEKTYVPAALVGASLIFLGIDLFYDAMPTLKHFKPEMLRDLSVVMPTLAAVFALLSVCYFFFNAYIKDCTSTSRASASFIAILFLCIYPAYLYFNDSLPINAPNKVVDQLAYLVSAIFFLYEARISLGRDKWGLYATFGMIAALLCAYSAIPSLIVYFANGEIISDSIAENALTLSLFIFIASRLALMRTLPQNAKTELVARIADRAEARRLEIGDSDIIQAQSGEQMEFDMSLLENEPEAEDAELKYSDNDVHSSGENYETAEELVGITETEEAESADENVAEAESKEAESSDENMAEAESKDTEDAEDSVVKAENDTEAQTEAEIEMETERESEEETEVKNKSEDENETSESSSAEENAEVESKASTKETEAEPELKEETEADADANASKESNE